MVGAICMGTNLDDERTFWDTVWLLSHPTVASKKPFCGSKMANISLDHLPEFDYDVLHLGTLVVINKDEWENMQAVSTLLTVLYRFGTKEWCTGHALG